MVAALQQLGESERAATVEERARWSLDRLKQDQPEQVTAFLEDAWNAMVGGNVLAGGE
jgi:hypothetical protein